jgi:diguanylate cyclase (GGDEF)-like protein
VTRLRSATGSPGVTAASTSAGPGDPTAPTPPGDATTATRETAGITTRLVVMWIRRHHGDDGVRRLLALAGERRPAAVLEDEATWSTYEQKLALFAAAAEVAGDPQVMRRIGAALLEEQLGGATRLLIGALGSPQQVLRSCARANAKFSTTSTMRALEVRPGRGVVEYRVPPGCRPSRLDCDYTRGILSQVTALFGLPPAMVDHPACQVDGHPWCRYVVLWSRWSRWRRPTGWGPLRGRDVGARNPVAVQALHEKVVDLQRTAADLVSSDDLDVVLRRIAARASAAVLAPQFLLAVRLDDADEPRIHSEGLEPDLAATAGAALLAHGPAGEPGPAPGPEARAAVTADEACGSAATSASPTARIVAPVASAGRRYGWLAAYLPGDHGFLPDEQAQLEAYARFAAAALDAATSLRLARRRTRMAEALLTFGAELATRDDVPAVAQQVVAAVPTVLGADRANVLLWDPDAEVVRSVAAGGYGPTQAAARRLTIAPADTPELDRLRAEHRPRWYDQDVADPWIAAALAALGGSAVAVAPLRDHDGFLGLVLASYTRGAPTPSDTDVLTRGLGSLADQAGVAIARIRLLERTRHQATHDELTGLGNRRLFLDRLSSALLDRRRGGMPVAVAFLDLDGFKSVNDGFGHAVGDELLVALGARLAARVRSGDLVARLAGDEFGVLLRGIDDPDGAAAVVANLEAAVAEPVRLSQLVVEIGVSAGVTVAVDGDTPEQLLRRSDAAMYDVKARRRADRERGTGARA